MSVLSKEINDKFFSISLSKWLVVVPFCIGLYVLLILNVMINIITVIQLKLGEISLEFTSILGMLSIPLIIGLIISMHWLIKFMDQQIKE